MKKGMKKNIGWPPGEITTSQERNYAKTHFEKWKRETV